VIEAWDGPTEVGDTPEIRQRHEEYIINRLKIRGVTHFYSSEFYGEHMSVALGAVNRVIDPERKIVPVSATQIREDAFAYRRYIDPLVYRDLITNVVFLGAPSTGKSTLAERMAHEYETAWMPEYGRQYWEEHQVNRRLSLTQLVEIAEGHLEREDDLLYQSNRYLFTDTNAITTFMFSQYYHQAALPRLVELADQSAARYDIVFLCDADIPYDDSWDRSGEVNRQVFQKQIKAVLMARKTPFFILQGDLETRVATVKGVLHKYQKYASLNILDWATEP
jgi:NadR type nicotinamide-nucleotide adenylyltransferase